MTEGGGKVGDGVGRRPTGRQPLHTQRRAWTASPNKEDGRSSPPHKKIKMFTMEYALKTKPHIRRVTGSRDMLKHVYPELKCDHPSCPSYAMLTYTESAYYSRCVDTVRWWDTGMISTFAKLIVHDTHRTNIMYIDCPFPNGKPKKVERLPAEILEVVSIVCNSSHFVVLRFVPANKKVFVMDGLALSLSAWKTHIFYILAGLGHNHHHWSVHMEQTDWHQHDSYNCGPIACVHMWRLFQPNDQNFAKLRVTEFRATVVKKLKTLLKTHDKALTCRLRKDPNDDNISFESSAKYCRICWYELAFVDEDGLHDFAECGHKVHLSCLKVGMETKLTCPKCTPCRTSHRRTASSPSVARRTASSPSVDERTKRVADRAALQKSNNKKRKIAQSAAAAKMIGTRRTATEVELGAVVTVRVDVRDMSGHTNMGLTGIIVKKLLSGSNSVVVATTSGVLHSLAGPIYYSPTDYKVKKTATIPLLLQEIQEAVWLEGESYTFDHLQMVTMAKAHKKCYPTGSTIGSGRGKCSCKAKCGPACGCRKKNIPCSSACKCSGTNCGNDCGKQNDSRASE